MDVFAESEMARQNFRAQKDQVVRDEKSIHNLSNEILKKIFGMLSLFDRVNVEKVCKQWKYVSQEIRERSATQKLNLPIPGISVWALKDVLEYSNSCLTHIDFSQYGENLGDMAMLFIANNCKNIQFMDVTSVKLTQSGIKYLEPIFHNITEFKFGSCRDCDESLSRLFRRNNKLKSLKVESIKSDLKFFTESPISDSLEKLILDDIDSNFSSLCSAAHKYKNIHTIFIKDCYHITEEIWTALTKWENLKHVQFSGNFNGINSLNNISSLTHLESLDVSLNQLVDDNFLKCIVNRCPYLNDVNVSYCNSITDDGLKVISNLSSLKNLNISYLKNVKEFTFMKMEHLEMLMCCGCPNLKTEHIANILFGSLKLQYLNISYCKEIRNSILEVIELLNEIRPSSLLKINIYGTGIIKKFKTIPNVKLITHDENKSKISIDKLNMDCLTHILSYLPLKDKLTASLVCSKWNLITEELLPDITELTYNTVKTKKLNFDDLLKILKYCGNKLLYIDFDICEIKMEDFSHFISIVGKHCKNLQSVNITKYKLTAVMVHAFCYLKRLRSLTVGKAEKWDLALLFATLPNLRHFTILNSFLIDDCFSELIYTKLKTLAIQECRNFYRSDIVDVISTFRKLRHLSISECTDKEKYCPHLILNLTTVTSLRLVNNNPPITIGNMPNLRSLDVSNYKNFNDDLLDEICKKCKNLTELNISHCTAISDAALSSLNYLKDLKYLKMNGLLYITDPKIENLNNLKILECKGCRNLYNAGLFALVNTSLSLEILDLSNCGYITHDLINHIICLRKKANSHNVLIIYLGGTSVDKNALIEFMPFIQLCDSSYKGANENFIDQSIPTVCKRPHNS